MQCKQAVVSYPCRRVLRRTRANVITIQISAGWIRRSKSPNVAVAAWRIFWIACVVLRNRLHRPLHGVAAHIFHGRAKSDMRRVGIQANHARKLYSSVGIERSRKFYAAILFIRKFSKGEFPVIEQVRIASPLLFIVVPLRQQPKFVSAIVEPVILGWRHVLSGELRIYKEKIMPVEAHLHQSPTILWHDDELHPAIGNLLRFPPFVVNIFHPALHGSCLRSCLSSSLRRSAYSKQDRHREDASCHL